MEDNVCRELVEYNDCKMRLYLCVLQYALGYTWCSLHTNIYTWCSLHTHTL